MPNITWLQSTGPTSTKSSSAWRWKNMPTVTGDSAVCRSAAIILVHAPTATDRFPAASPAGHCHHFSGRSLVFRPSVDLLSPCGLRIFPDDAQGRPPSGAAIDRWRRVPVEPHTIGPRALGGSGTPGRCYEWGSVGGAVGGGHHVAPG